MNIWIARLGTKSFTQQENNKVHQLLRQEFQSEQYQSFEFKKASVHYLSFIRDYYLSNKTYNHLGSNGQLTAYSGILIGNQSASVDYKNAEALQQIVKSPRELYEKIAGNFGIVYASDNMFQCFTDNNGIHKIFYYHAPDETVYISNFIDLIKIFKNNDFNDNVTVDWLTTGMTFFQETEEVEVYTLPEYGKIAWAKGQGFKTTQVKNPTEIVFSQKSNKKLLDSAAQTLRNNARYLKNYHNTTVALSGGYESRMVLSMFWGLDHTNLDAYTFKENFYDLPIAKKVAQDHKVKHHVLEFKDPPTIEELHRHLEKVNYPYLKYSNIFDYLVSQELKKIYHNRHTVVLKGSAGNHDRTFKKFQFLKEYEGEKAISKLTDYLLRDNSLLRPEALTIQKKRIEDFYRQKYLDEIAHRSTSHKLHCLQYRENYKRTNSYRGKQIHNNAMDQYLPLLNDAVMELVFHATYRQLMSSKRCSIIHQLIMAFTNGKDNPIHFESGLHWEANKLSRVNKRFQRAFIDPYIKKLSGQEEKFASKTKNQFYKKNINSLLEIVLSSNDSVLWNYFDKARTLQVLNESKDQMNSNEIEFIYKLLVPSIKTEYRRDNKYFPPSINFR